MEPVIEEGSSSSGSKSQNMVRSGGVGGSDEIAAGTKAVKMKCGIETGEITNMIRTINIFEMSKVLPGLYVGNYRDSKDPQQLDRYNISHIIAIHDSPRRLLADKHYLCVMAADTPDQNLSQYFPVCNDFIHAARLRDGNVLIHCLAGMSRSVTVAVAYIMSATSLSWKEALKVVRVGRSVANPNLGFQTQLQEFELYRLPDERRRLKERFPSLALCGNDRQECNLALNNYEELLSNRDICEGHCIRGQDCPTGMCRTDSTKGIFRRKTSSASIRSSRLAPQSTTTQSCPTSPRYNTRTPKGRGAEVAGPSTASGISRDVGIRIGSSSSSTALEVMAVETSNNSKIDQTLHRSASAVSNFRGGNQQQQGGHHPSGFCSYTGSAPPSVHGSRVDLTNPTHNTGSAIYLGFNPQGRNNYQGSSSWSVSKISSSGGSAPPTPVHTPPVSPKHGAKRLIRK